MEFGHNEALNEISDVINTSYGYPNLIHVFWMNDLVKDSYQNDGNKLIFKTYKNLIKKYPKKFLEERFFNMTYQMYPYFFIKVGNRISIEDRHRIYKDVLKMTPLPKVNDSYMDNYYNLFFRDSISDYINIDLRSFVISKISFNNSFSDKIIFNYFIPLLLLIFLSYLSIQKRNVILFLSFASIWSLFFVVFLTAPESRFMYYFSVYLSCYVFSFYALAWCIFPLKKQV